MDGRRTRATGVRLTVEADSTGRVTGATQLLTNMATFSTAVA